MSTFALIHGAGSTGWDWHLVEHELRSRGHEVVAPDLPCADETADLDTYAETVVKALSDRGAPLDDIVVVAHSLGGLTAPLVCRRVPARLLVLVNAMIPAPGETGMQWWSNTGQSKATEGDDYDEHELFFHDVPAPLVTEARRRAGDQAAAAMEQPWPGSGWPEVPTKFLLCRDDRLFPAQWMRGLVKHRLNITPDEIGGGHYVALARPVELARRLDAFARPAGAT